MESEEDPARSSKRRQLADPRSRTQTRSYLSLVSTIDVPSPPHRQNDRPTTIDEAKAAAPQDPSSKASCVGDDGGANADEAGECDQCCYGMLSDIPIKFISASNIISSHVPVLWQSPNKLSSQTGGASILFEITNPTTSRILDEFELSEKIMMQLYCHSKPTVPSGEGSKGRRQGKISHSWFLNAILFGSLALETTVGDYLSGHRMYLQDPLRCECSVQYRNPHVLPPELGEIIMTDSFNSLPGNLEVARLDVGPDLLAQLMEDELLLTETEAPGIVKTALFRHQKQALTFMLRQEEGWALDNGAQDIWSKQTEPSGRSKYRNNVDGSYSDEPPPKFHGGLLADDMGLGKTLSMICLIAANHASKSLPSPPITPDPPISYSLSTTLLIVPPALIQVWEKQFQLHLQSDSLKIHTYHGQNKKDIKYLGQFDIVITTYHTMSAIWRKYTGNADRSESIFSVTWDRIILDEAHAIQNSESQLSRACCALRSTKRWAITGTPIQNKLTDFASIVKFLKVYPYCDRKIFDKEILGPWQKRQRADPQGFLRLKTLVRAITISRTKRVVQLPPRVDEIHRLNFAPVEREKYEAAKIQSRTLLEEAISSGNHQTETF